MKRVSFLKFLIPGLCCLLILGLSACQDKGLYKENRVMMGTYVEVISPDSRAAGIAFAEIKRAEDNLSKYRPESAVFRLNRDNRIDSDLEIAYLIREAKYFWLISDGAFDITVGPLMELWGFTDHKYRVPTQEEINAVLPRIGMDMIILKDNKNVVEFKVPDMKIDFGAIAKGYAVDCAISRLRKAGVKSCLINAGGDIYCLGEKFGRPWNVAIMSPTKENVLGFVELKDKAIATSGNYEQYFIRDNRRYSHIFNPKTGYPVNSGIASVTVIAPDCLTADALATTIFVMGKEKGLAMASKIPDVTVRIFEQKDVEEAD